MRRLEKSIERAFVNWVVNNHPTYKCIKLSPEGTNGWADRLIVGPHRYMVFIEFKRPGEEPTPLQQFYADYLTGCDHDIEICYSVEEAKEVFYSNICPPQVPRRNN